MEINKRVLIVDDEASVRLLLREIVQQAGYEPFTAENGLEAVGNCRSLNPAVIFMDIRMPVMDGLEAFEIIRKEYPDTPVILMTAYGTVQTAMEAVKKGCFDYLVKPSNIREVRAILDRAFKFQLINQNISVPALTAEDSGLNRIIGRGAVMQQLFKLIGRVAETNSTVLITGESGSGKELIAKTIHENSPRKNRPFIKVNCGAIPENLMESEFFGYEKGAFTGAITRKPGRFELANTGTLFLDEVGELPPALQVKLLRVLQEREFERVGGTVTIKVDVRIIAATNRDLEELVKSGAMREDLYYRLKVVPLRVPPLRERKEDIPSFVEYFLNHFASDMHRKQPYVSPEAMELLMNYHWPGNVRELANVLERAVIMSAGVITPYELPGLAAAVQPQNARNEQRTLKEILQQVEKEVIAKTLHENNGNKAKTAKILDISRSALLYKIEQYGLSEQNASEDNE